MKTESEQVATNSVWTRFSFIDLIIIKLSHLSYLNLHALLHEERYAVGDIWKCLKQCRVIWVTRYPIQVPAQTLVQVASSLLSFIFSFHASKICLQAIEPRHREPLWARKKPSSCSTHGGLLSRKTTNSNICGHVIATAAASFGVYVWILYSFHTQLNSL